MFDWWRYSWLGRKTRNIYYEIRNRFFARYYIINLRKMPRGAWWDADSRLFEAVFQILVDFVEGELGSDGKISRFQRKYYQTELDNGEYVHPHIQVYLRQSLRNRIRFRKSWAGLLGIAHLDWAAQLDSSEHEDWKINVRQAEQARKVKELYDWYMIARKQRKNPYDLTLTDEIFREEQRQYDEDTEKAQQVLAIRQGMWT